MVADLARERDLLVGAQLAAGLGRPRTPVLDLALRAKLGHVDTLTAFWLELDDAKRDQIPVERLAELATAAFRGSPAAP